MGVFTKCVVLLCAAIAATSGRNVRAENVVFHLFTRQNPSVSQPILASVQSIMDSPLQQASRTVVTVHDQGDAVAGNFNAFVVPAELTAYDVNVIAIDWSNSGSPSQVGEAIAYFLDFLVGNFDYDAQGIRLVGFGVGAHIAGIAARKAEADITHLIALDPTLNGWSDNPDRLTSNVAVCVETLHTSALGVASPVGKLDFYPNGGSSQNGCEADNTCSHDYAYLFYSESLTAEVQNSELFVGTKCNSYEAATQSQCNGAKDIVFGGRAIKESESGIYTFTTNPSPPFARG
ncbi:unnamed protein product [Plutella xylostella]|uniref:(diamondback moth) hypothetical protein n=1 Tax=Plutella xylostella TaxID=51655 RepID=A0A8S4EQL7_PLUXY|nr:unnamed protein product [Plutella xylostella]